MFLRQQNVSEKVQKQFLMVLTFEPVDEIPKSFKRELATEGYVSAVLFVMLYKVVLTFGSAD